MQDETSKAKAQGIDEESFERCKKSFYGRLVRGFNNVETVANGLVTSYFAGVDIYDNIKTVEKMDLSFVQSVLESSLQADKAALSIIEPVK